MAFATKRRGSSYYTVYYYDKKEGKQRALPRKETPPEIHNMTPDQVKEWLLKWEAENNLQVHRALRFRLRERDELRKLWEDFQTHWQLFREIGADTLVERNHDFELYILPYFVGQLGLKNVRKWNGNILDFTKWLVGSRLKNAVARKKVLWMLKRFGEYLTAKGVLAHPWVVMIPTKNKKRETPLTTAVTPATAIGAANSLVGERPILALAILVGYFGSLGPAEVYGLHKEDFLTGEQATALAKTYEGLKRHEEFFKGHPLGSRLSVYIQRQVTSKRLEKFPKNDYRCAVVNIWHTEAATLIAELLRDMPPGRLFGYSRDHLDKLQRDHIKKKLGTTGHDLRRASALYLGRTVRLPLELLQRHLRHSQLSTTELYIREPKNLTEIIVDEQDFDDVV